MPSPVTLDTGTMGAPAKLVRSSASVSSSVATSRSSGSTRSILVERDHAGGDAEQRADREVLARLRHHALVRRHHQDHQIDAAQPRQRVVHEALVARHVDEAELDVALDQMREPDVDGDAARALLLPAVAVDAGERLDQRGLAVVDVPRGADHDAAGGERLGAGRSASLTESRISRRCDSPSLRRRRRRSASSSPSSPDRSRSGRRGRARRPARGSPGADRPPTPAPAGSARGSRPRAAPCPAARGDCPARTAARPRGAA